MNESLPPPLLLRDARIDFLRFIGLSMIILAHVNPPLWLFQLRNFDVPLMAFVSGLAADLTSADAAPGLGYFWKRIKRLVFPVWIFLTLYFLVVWSFHLNVEQLHPRLVLESYLLLDGIGYVWVVRVFLVIALATPALLGLSRRTPSNITFLSLFAAVAVVYELLLYLAAPYIGHFPFNVPSEMVFYGIGFSLAFVLGARFPRLGRGQAIGSILFAGVVFFALLFYHRARAGHFVQTQSFKYPPSAYYLSYALLASMIAYYAIVPVELRLRKQFPKVLSVVLFIARNTIWIYLLHIPVIKFFEAHPAGNFLERYACAYTLPALIVWLKNGALERTIMPRLASPRARMNARLLLTG